MARGRTVFFVGIAALVLPLLLGACSPAGDAGVDLDRVAPAEAVPEVLEPVEAVVGAFQVTLHPRVEATASSAGQEPYTWVLGLVNDGPSPAMIVWDTSRTEGPCTLFKPRSPFCDACPGASVCVEDGICLAHPSPVSVGTVTVSGVRTATGSSTFDLEPLAGNYQPLGVSLAYPGFAEGDPIAVVAEGAGELPGFALQAVGIAPLVVLTPSFVLDDGQPLPVAWTPASPGAASRVLVSLEIAHHGGYKGRVDCDVDDDGALVIPASLVDELKALGVAGFPTLSLTRQSGDEVSLPIGQVRLIVSTQVVVGVQIPGLVSCTADTDCPEGTSCRDDLTCR